MTDLQHPEPSPYAQFPEAPPRGLSIASLVIGIVSFFAGFTFVVPLIGIVLGVMGRRREQAGRGMALAGIWINAAILVVWAIITVIAIVVIAAGLFTIPLWADFG